MRWVVTASEMRELDRTTIEDIGLPGAVLMETAGRAVARVVADVAPPGGRVAVVCGAGNNGGDGYVVVRCLRAWGIAATAYLAAPEAAVRGDAALHLRALQQSGGWVAAIDDEAGLREHASDIATADVVVDALFGTGLARPIDGHYATVVDAINASVGVRVAVDIPSGVSADTGDVLGVAVRADHTVTMAFDKIGLVSAPGYARCGRVTVAEIGIPEQLASSLGVALARVDATDAARWLPRSSSLDHKGTRGHVLIVAGSPGKRGAGRLAATAALRAGAGLVTLAAAGRELVAPDPVMTAELDVDAAGAGAVLARLVDGKRAVAIGPGMPVTDGARELVRTTVRHLAMPLVVDADGLNHLVGAIDAVAASTTPVVLTPHPGEAARLLDVEVSDVQRDRVGAARRLADISGAIVVLKGARTVVCDGGAADRFTTINTSGHQALATAGTGDVLTGAIAALIACGAAPADAARLGVWVHGRAAERAADSRGRRGVVATDVIDELPGALAELDGDD